MNQNPELSIVVPVYNEEPSNLSLLIDRLDVVLKPLLIFYEVVFVDDGSNKNTAQALEELVDKHRHIRLVTLSRNFGESAAISAGLDHALGSAIVNMDSDLQDPPELIPTMLQYWKDGYDIVFTRQATRKEHWLRQICAKLFYRLFRALCFVRIPVDAGEFRLLSRRAADAVNALPQKRRFLRALIPMVGFKQIIIPFDRNNRESGQSQYSLSKLIRLAVESVASFTFVPMYASLILGTILTTVSLPILMYMIAKSATGNYVVPTLLGLPASLWTVITLLGGLQQIAIGFNGMYMSRIVQQINGFPTYIVANKSGWRNQPDSEAADHKLHTGSEPAVDRDNRSGHISSLIGTEK